MSSNDTASASTADAVKRAALLSSCYADEVYSAIETARATLAQLISSLEALGEAEGGTGSDAEDIRTLFASLAKALGTARDKYGDWARPTRGNATTQGGGIGGVSQSITFDTACGRLEAAAEELVSQDRLRQEKTRLAKECTAFLLSLDDSYSVDGFETLVSGIKQHLTGAKRSLDRLKTAAQNPEAKEEGLDIPKWHKHLLDATFHSKVVVNKLAHTLGNGLDIECANMELHGNWGVANIDWSAVGLS